MNILVRILFATCIVNSLTILCMDEEHKAKAASNEELLLMAAKKGDVASVTSLLAKGVKVDTRDSVESTPLMIAAECGFEQMIRLLLKHKANTNLQNKFGDTALLVAVDKNHTVVARILLHNNANPNVASHKGYSSLLFSASKGCSEMVSLLIASKADVCSRATNGQIPLGEAIYGLAGTGTSKIDSSKNYAHVIKTLYLYQPFIEKIPQVLGVRMDLMRDYMTGKLTYEYKDTITEEDIKKIQHDIAREEDALKAVKQKL